MAEDPELKVLLEVITNDWPENAKDLQKCLRTHWSMKDFINVEDGILPTSQRIMIPRNQWQGTLNKLDIKV